MTLFLLHVLRVQFPRIARFVQTKMSLNLGPMMSTQTQDRKFIFN